MSEIKRDEIVYEEGWRDARLSEPIEEDEIPAVDERPAEEEKKPQSRQLLVTVQLIICMMAALVLFVLKAMDSEAYHGFMKAYAEEMAKPVVSQKFFDAVDWNALFGGDRVSVSATPDELSRR